MPTQVRRTRSVSPEELGSAYTRRLHAIVQGMPVMLDAFDERGYIVAWNAECERVTGYKAAEVIGVPNAMEMLYPDATYRSVMLAEARLRRHQEYDDEWELTARDGSKRIVHWYNVGARLRVPGWVEWSVGVDVTERRRLEEALLDARHREQRRLGAELHDSLGQELTGLALLVASLARDHAVTDPALARELAEVASIASRAIATCRNIARGLAPIGTSPEELRDALRELTADFAAHFPDVAIVYSEDVSAALRLSVEDCNQMLRIAQEAMTNTLKHAGAQTLRVQLSTGTGSVCLEMKDDGGGIPAGACARDGMGLRTMRDRAAAIGAHLFVGAGPFGGTIIRCECPNRPSQAASRGRGPT